MTKSGVRTPGFVARPARRELLHGTIHGKQLYQYDFTEEQYHALVRLTATLSRVLPRIALQVPRLASGAVDGGVVDKATLEAFGGLVGHWHLTRSKIDPGPAFDWDRVLREARELR